MQDSNGMVDAEMIPVQNGFGMKNGFTRRIRVVDGVVRPVLEISRVEVARCCSWIPSSIESLFGTRCRVCLWVAFEGGCKVSRLEERAFCGSGFSCNSNPRIG
jgi:hypothetical protein